MTQLGNKVLRDCGEEMEGVLRMVCWGEWESWADGVVGEKRTD
jgi:hypothetical protein